MAAPIGNSSTTCTHPGSRKPWWSACRCAWMARNSRPPVPPGNLPPPWAHATACPWCSRTNATARARRRNASRKPGQPVRGGAASAPRSMPTRPPSYWNAGCSTAHPLRRKPSHPDLLQPTPRPLPMSPRLRHLTSLDRLPRATIERLLDSAERLRDACAHGTRKLEVLAGRTVLTMFFEPSTRTRTSFELAARRLGADVVNLNIELSSVRKGEELVDTLHTLEAMHLDAIIVRHAQPGTAEAMVRLAMSGVSVINAGDGEHAHPTQRLLDALTIRQHWPDFSRLKVAICGDIKHSRVARADLRALTTLGAQEIRLCAPPAMMPGADEFPQAQRLADFDQAIAGVDAVIMLRLQKERMQDTELPDPT